MSDRDLEEAPIRDILEPKWRADEAGAVDQMRAGQYFLIVDSANSP